MMWKCQQGPQMDGSFSQDWLNMLKNGVRSYYWKKKKPYTLDDTKQIEYNRKGDMNGRNVKNIIIVGDQIVHIFYSWRSQENCT